MVPTEKHKLISRGRKRNRAGEQHKASSDINHLTHPRNQKLNLQTSPFWHSPTTLPGIYKSSATNSKAYLSGLHLFRVFNRYYFRTVKQINMSIRTITLLPSSVRSRPLSTPNLDNPRDSGLYPNGHGYGIAVWFGIASAILAATLILIYVGYLTHKAIKRTRERRYVGYFVIFFLPLRLRSYLPLFFLICSQNVKAKGRDLTKRNPAFPILETC